MRRVGLVASVAPVVELARHGIGDGVDAAETRRQIDET
jgi:hypothetical protein